MSKRFFTGIKNSNRNSCALEYNHKQTTLEKWSLRHLVGGMLPVNRVSQIFKISGFISDFNFCTRTKFLITDLNHGIREGFINKNGFSPKIG